MADLVDDSRTTDKSDTDSSSGQRPVTTDTWKGQLDFERPCSGPDNSWPGKLLLRSLQCGEGVTERYSKTVAAETSFLLSWLLQHHPCIDELNIGYGVHPGVGKEATPFPIRLRPAAAGSDSRRTIRSLELQAHARFRSSNTGFYHDCYKLEDLDAVTGLESLKLGFSEITPNVDAELAKLLRRNAGSLKKLEIGHVKVPRRVNKAVRYLFQCESLTLSSYHDSVLRLLHSSTALKELSVAQIADTSQLCAIAEELETNASLNVLAVHLAGWHCFLEPLFATLRLNTTLRELRVTGCLISGQCGQALRAMLLKNTSLRLLYIGDAHFSEFSLVLLALALAKNTTLESLHISAETLPMFAIGPLCEALRTNKTLKKLHLTDFEWLTNLTFRKALAILLTRDDLYGRVHLPWSEPDLPGLSGALSSPLASLEEFLLPNICSLSVAGVKRLFNALAANKCVRALGVSIRGDPRKKGTALCEMLKANRTIECLNLMIDKDTYHFVEELCRALAENVGVTKVLLIIHEVRKFETATALSYLLAHNRTATKFFFCSSTSLYPEFLEELSQGMLQNRTIVKFRLAHILICDDQSFRLFEAVRTNQDTLNRAVDFVVSPSLDRQCAEGFERFSGRPCLLKHLKKFAGKTEPEALLCIAAAERYLRENYLLITGVVRHSVNCHPAEGTQADALNGYCWLAIVRHLKVADVRA